MGADLPEDRVAVRSRATFQILLGCFGVAGGASMLTGLTQPSDHGWTGAVPDSWHPAIATLVVIVGLGFAVPGLTWAFVPVRGPRPPVVHFDASLIEIRGSLVPKTFVVDKGSVQSVHLWTFGRLIPPSFGLGPMVVVRTADGRGKGIQYLYDGEPQTLLDDVARWASAPIGPTRRGVFGAPTSAAPGRSP